LLLDSALPVPTMATTTRFDLVTDWDLAAPVEAVWDALIKPEEWPSWWRAVVKVELIAPGDEHGIGACRRMTWRTALPYRVSFNMRTVRVEPRTLIEGRADGELSGTGRWTLTPSGGRTQVRYEWIVEVTKPWMRLVAPLARPVFAWNHNVVMGWGYDGLARKLGCAPRE
jgi:uncharacterized protein YndB with AHSA1/START domain